MRFAREAHEWLVKRPQQNGYLIGGPDGDDILGAVGRIEDKWAEDKTELDSHLPLGLGVWGVYGTSATEALDTQKALKLEFAAAIEDDEVVLFRSGEKIEYELVDGADIVLDSYVIVRHRCTGRGPTATFTKRWLGLRFPSGNIEPLRYGAADQSGSFDAPLEDLLAAPTVAALGEGDGGKAAGASKKKKGKGGGGKSGGPSQGSSTSAAATSILRQTSVGPVLDVSLVSRFSSEDSPNGACGPAVHVSWDAAPATPPVRLDCELLIYASKKAHYSELCSAALSGLEAVWRDGEARGGEGQAMEAVVYHVLPRGFVFPLRLSPRFTVASLTKGAWTRTAVQEDGAALQTVRRRLHERLGLSLDRPVFRSTCALSLEPAPAAASNVSAGSSERLMNVHVGLPPSGVSGGTQHMVDGPYLYYHYMQDRFDDRGWGCAYRSLQTICSFFLLNNYTTKAVPSHKDIQQLLVNIGDKPSQFVGSSEWIGSMEVGFYLDQELGITWRNIFTNTGPELTEKARELANHFDTHGTPVMMGGGNLAFTVLGVDWNESTGDVKFLILDPHYTGAEDIKAIQTKEVNMEGYKATPCGWRPASTFAKHSFYNLCLPERPRMY